jgi:tRNA A37 threonylcarbamoyladenosine synthetase subunit TsaC/SUA5/YrdC
VVDCSGELPRVLRAGAIAPAEVAAVLEAAGFAHSAER